MMMSLRAERAVLRPELSMTKRCRSKAIRRDWFVQFVTLRSATIVWSFLLAFDRLLKQSLGEFTLVQLTCVSLPHCVVCWIFEEHRCLRVEVLC